MSDTVAGRAADPSGSGTEARASRIDKSGWLAIGVLGVSQVIGYGTLYYGFSILAPSMARDVGWPTEWLFGALSVALLVGGLASPQAGRAIDRYGAGRVMTAGSVLAATALVAGALSTGGITLTLALIVAEIASTLVQYSAAFPLLVQRQPRTAQRSIVYLTLIGGFASTIFWPITAALHSVLSWREVYLVFAALHLVVCLPIHAWLAGPTRTTAAGGADARTGARPEAVDGNLPAVLRRKAFVMMVAAFAFQGFVSAAILVHMVPLLAALGLGGTSVLVGTLFGPAQVLSRFINMMFGRGLSQIWLAMISAVLLPVAIALLLFTAPSLAGAVVFSVVFGMGNGLYSIVTGTLPLTLFGSAGYGSRQGVMMSVKLIVASAAPFAFAVLMEKLDAGWALGVTIGLGIGSVLALAWIARWPRHAQ
ncbi:arsenite efflux MFS transporter ArsK [Zavarzinia compransoris]|uniref:MFS transporter n=1 Tax=Zavarzinia compransoris TaxID=1264899 RepID=A0A317DWU5_9PROT|nr:arsenite efflux MFS transporter ArsK [Zavarzinia compransoris]PWR18336.1 MFS transporter [Zavarzinia compransoris]TDP43603.1 putative MFS family arabinose efflux permease [Zavarzinia compransoris]